MSRWFPSSFGVNGDEPAAQVRRYLRFIRLESNPKKVSGLVVQVKHYARAAWHMAVKREAAR
jgi:hypothetical protein